MDGSTIVMEQLRKLVLKSNLKIIYLKQKKNASRNKIIVMGGLLIVTKAL